MSNRYLVSFELPGVDPLRVDLDVAYAAARQVVISGLAAYGYVGIDASKELVPITVQLGHEQPRDWASMRWSVNVPGHPRTHPMRSLSLAVDTKERRGAAIIMLDDATPAKQYTVYIAPRQMARIVRAVMTWPLDMLETMARDDEGKDGE